MTSKAKEMNLQKVDLIEHVRKQTCLYDKKDTKYKDNRFKDEVWLSLSVKLNMTGMNEAKKMFKGLKDEYFKQKKKMKRPSGSGVSSDSAWPYYSHMTWIDGFYEERKERMSTLDGTSQASSLDDDENDDNGIGEKENSTTHIKTEDFSNERPPKKRNRSGDVIGQELLDLFKKTNDDANKEHTENELFGMSVTKALDSLTEDKQIRTRFEIQKLLYQIRYTGEFEQMENCGSCPNY